MRIVDRVLQRLPAGTSLLLIVRVQHSDLRIWLQSRVVVALMADDVELGLNKESQASFVFSMSGTIVISEVQGSKEDVMRLADLRLLELVGNGGVLHLQGMARGQSVVAVH